MDNLELEKGISAVNLVFENSERFYITNEFSNVVVFDKTLNKVCHIIGTFAEYAEIMTKYAEVPCEFIVE